MSEYWWKDLLDRQDRWQGLELVVREGNGQAMEKQVVPVAVGKFDLVDTGIRPIMRPQLVTISPGEPASEAKLAPGDVVVAVDAERAPTRERIIEIIKGHENQPLMFEVLRGGTRRETVKVKLAERPARAP